MDEFYPILEFLPLHYDTPSDAIYFQKLIKATEHNFITLDYHLALASLHLIYMSVVYHYIYQLFRTSPTKFDSILIGFHNHLNLKDNKDLTWHSFCKIKESNIFEFYRSVGLRKDQIGTLKKPVQDRNELLHANGIYIDSEDIFKDRLEKYLKCLEKIDTACQINSQKLYKRFLRSVSVKLLDIEDAQQYLQENFIKNYGINLAVCKRLSKIKKLDYPGRRDNAKLFYKSLQDLVE